MPDPGPPVWRWAGALAAAALISACQGGQGAPKGDPNGSAGAAAGAPTAGAPAPAAGRDQVGGGDVATAAGASRVGEPPAASGAPRLPQYAARTLDSLGNPAPLEPDPRLTPGDTLPVSTEDICVAGYSRKVRNVPAEVRREVYARYGVPSHRPGEYELDHLISLELGGSNSVRNLWPESHWTTPWNARVKDRLENRLHRDVCDGRLDLHTAQRAIATDWIAAYGQYMGRSAVRRPASGAR